MHRYMNRLIVEIPRLAVSLYYIVRISMILHSTRESTYYLKKKETKYREE